MSAEAILRARAGCASARYTIIISQSVAVVSFVSLVSESETLFHLHRFTT